MARIRKEQIKKGKYQRFVVKFYWLIIILIFLVALGIEYFFIVKPKLEQTFSGGPLDVESRQVILQEQKTYYEELKLLEKQANEINYVELEKINYVLDKNVNLPSILRQIETLRVLAKQSNLELGGFDFSFDKGILIINLSLAGGNYQSVKEYLSEIEKNIRVMDVTGISLKSIGSNFSLTIQSYYLE